MPVTKSAKKKLRKDRKRENLNQVLKIKLKKAIKQTIKAPTIKKISETSKIIDKAAKKGIIHSNKAARLKSKFSKHLPSNKSKKRG